MACSCKRSLRNLAVSSTLLALGGCTLPAVRISDAPLPVPLPRVPDVVDRRPASDLGLRPRDPQRDPVGSYYLADKDTLPDRMSVLRTRLSAVAYLQAPGARVLVDKFDILYDGSGNAEALSLDLSGKGLGMLGTTPIGNGINGYRCTLIASVDGQPGGPIREVARGQYARVEGAIGITPQQEGAARDCVAKVIDQWSVSAKPWPTPAKSAPVAPAPKKRAGKRGKS